MTAGRRTVLWLGVYAVSMGYLELAVVIYLRRILSPADPLSLFPLRLLTGPDLLVEFAREAATLAMILTVALLAVPGRTRRVAAFLYVFGVWDLAYYLWLKIALGWPVRWTEWDILFLIPWPWLAPWVTPAVVALLFAAWGGGALWREADPVVPRRVWLLAASGLLLVLASFLEPALPLLGRGAAGLQGFVPSRFLCGLYLPGTALLAAGLFIGRAGPGAHPPPARPPVTSR